MLAEKTVQMENYERAPLAGDWLGVLRRYFLFVLPAHLAWETLQLPLYRIWHDGTAGEIAFAVIHCTAGDMLISAACLLAALLATGTGQWPAARFRAVAGLAIALGVSYTVFSEWLNLVVRESWAYSDLMPLVPPLGTGLSPVLQWIAIPLAGFYIVRRGRT
jgi:hypothetical protein